MNKEAKKECGTKTVPVGSESVKRCLTAKDYDKYIKSLQEEVEQLHIQLLDVSCNLSSLKKQLEVAKIERTKITKKTKKATKEVGIKS